MLTASTLSHHSVAKGGVLLALRAFASNHAIVGRRGRHFVNSDFLKRLKRIKFEKEHEIKVNLFFICF